ncbi:restriction endonuclease subunit S [Paraclostridium sordellii]|uniref:restriction endonuclease subunit S n=1 Tax=Paraclostridium sordellii TaxID=1505 RepID=UPI0005DB81C7|nr:restriction endonuclease subunit S [Paeniclostridium sordellii]CEN81215.1 type I restriction-modification enzyme [[Clostridium] sordellii] [Paeniclostridium sordellii]
MKEGYKKTEVGVIPEDWEVKSINDISYINPESLKSSTNKKLEIKYIDIESVSTGKISGVKNHIFEEAPSRARRIIKKDDVIVSTVRPNLKAIANIKSDLPNLVCSTGFAVLRNKKNISAKFLYQSILSDIVTNQLVNKTVGSNYPAVNSTDIKETLIIVPPLKEQEKIADILSTVDCQIDDTEMLIEKCQELKKGLMQRLLTKGIGHKEFKKTEVGEIPVDWEVKKLEDVSYITMGQSPSSDSYNDKGIGVPFFQGNSEFGNIYPTVKKWCSEPKKIAEPLDILISVRAPVGAVNINNDRACIGRGLASIRQSNKINYMYLYYVLSISQDILNSSAQGSTFTAINSKDLKNFKIAIPSLDEQLKIAQILLSLDNNIEDYKNKKEKLEELKKGLMQQLLTGKIRTSI